LGTRGTRCASILRQAQDDLAEAKGYLDADRELPDAAANFGGLGPAIRVSNNNVSTVEPYRDVVKSLVDQGVEMVAIHRRLLKNHGYTGSYTSVRRFVRHLKPNGREVVVRIETAPMDRGRLRWT
jgi:transposase